jgi:DNA-binding XRE family transcriptional regulator
MEGYPQGGHGFSTSTHFSVFLRFGILLDMSYQITPRRKRRPARFPNAIRDYRIQAGLTQRKLGHLVGRSRSVISAWECGRYLPTLANVFRLARALDTLIENLYWSLYRPEHTEINSANTQPA